MHDRLSDADIKRIAEAVAALEIRGEEEGFRVQPEAHYNSHARLDRFLDTYDSASNIVCKFFIGLVLVGLVAAVGVSAGFHK